MRFQSKSFWKGFAMGALLFGIAGAFLLNHNIRFMHGVNSLHAGDRVFSWVTLLIEHGHLEQAESRLRVRSFHHHQSMQYHACMNRAPYHLWFSKAGERCIPLLEAKMPRDWTDPWKGRHTINEGGHLVGRDVSTPDP